MGTKNNPGKFDCYHNAEPDEPMFILLARDSAAISVIAEWMSARQKMIDKGDRPPTDIAKLTEARECMVAMEQWRKTHRPSR